MANLLLLIDDYLPDSTRVAAKMFHELAIELQKQGHSVTVATPSHMVFGTEYSELDGIQIIKFKSGNVKAASKIKRAINESLLSLNAWRALKKTTLESKFDYIICYSPSIFWGPLIKRFNCPTYLVLRDFFPQWAIDAGMIRRGSLIERYFRFFEHQLYSSVSKIGVMSEANLQLFEDATSKDFDTEVLRNWASLSPSDVSTTSTIRERLGLQHKVLFLYGGNIGHAQDMPVLIRLARAMNEHENAHFLFVGQGDQVELICTLAEQWNLDNFTFLPSISQDEFKSMLAQVDIGLFSLSSKHTTHNFPGKLLGYMANAIPILGCVNAGNDLKPLVVEQGAGFIHDNGEDELLYESALELLNSNELRARMGAASRDLLEREFSVESAALKIMNSLRVT